MSIITIRVHYLILASHNDNDTYLTQEKMQLQKNIILKFKIFYSYGGNITACILSR